MSLFDCRIEHGNDVPIVHWTNLELTEKSAKCDTLKKIVSLVFSVKQNLTKPNICCIWRTKHLVYLVISAKVCYPHLVNLSVCVRHNHFAEYTEHFAMFCCFLFRFASPNTLSRLKSLSPPFAQYPAQILSTFWKCILKVPEVSLDHIYEELHRY